MSWILTDEFSYIQLESTGETFCELIQVWCLGLKICPDLMFIVSWRFFFFSKKRFCKFCGSRSLPSSYQSLFGLCCQDVKSPEGLLPAARWRCGLQGFHVSQRQQRCPDITQPARPEKHQLPLCAVVFRCPRWVSVRVRHRRGVRRHAEDLQGVWACHLATGASREHHHCRCRCRLGVRWHPQQRLRSSAGSDCCFARLHSRSNSNGGCYQLDHALVWTNDCRHWHRYVGWYWCERQENRTSIILCSACFHTIIFDALVYTTHECANSVTSSDFEECKHMRAHTHTHKVGLAYI